MVFAYVKALTKRKVVGNCKIFCHVLHSFQEVVKQILLYHLIYHYYHLIII
jgi:hypothetical protein